ncbi:glycosyltransferase family 4 protein [Dactylosporangium vinaceum]|uniref:Glycosyltransferase family 4 protein n=1 Tax=Dactylosporangium vinaceum TaxID=53362 RepID=A0ABV5MIG0_9ACTN|nr:glycosyltransferase family 4 protein [Dactylosporangium vinaceum]UAB97605.1 glycosyltransferase family 4 protein [Dactylosporangium vinaceum]
MCSPFPAEPIGRIVLATTAAERGGLWKNVTDLATAFTVAGHDVYLAFPEGAVDLVRDARRLGLPFADLARSPQLNGAVFHLHLPKPFDRRTLPLMASARLRGHRVFVTEHLARHPSSDASVPWGPGHTPGLRKPGARYAKTLLKRTEALLAHQVIAVSENSKQFIMRRFALTDRKCTVVLNGIAPAEPVPLPPVQGGLRVAVVGAVTYKKGHDVLVDAAQRSRGTWTADVYGSGDLIDQLRRRAGNRVRFHGWVDDVAERVDQHHLLCMPSRYEQLPYAVTEAMMRGRPVVATNVDGLPEAVEDGINGRLIPPDDPDALAAALDHAEQHPDTVRQWALAAHAVAVDKFALAAMTDRILALYTRTVA